ncbi:hypothetical protein [Mangrovihabitans endophyticus]|uniref:Uncharacterized protein n=1 Tax=Mangrovihabitans endophyticus TaxID=1751298 RepID=A0A8J3FPS7_9ACTN|nr:hypothetical protein [Mangrovihabitans endophyticus]GGK97990.1 hypothetical protein GCM10012284_35300 [Mangrovihabitans endophyticus]
MAVGAWFRTEHDHPQHVIDLPATVTSGIDPGVAIVDQVVRGKGIVGRVTGDFGAVALRVQGTGRPTRVRVTVQLDELATRWWADRVKPRQSAAELPRLAILRVQGENRGAALLARRQGWRGAGNVKRAFDVDLRADEVDEDGLLVVELAEAPHPSWLADRVSPRSAIGLRFDSIVVGEPDGSGSAAAPPAAVGGSGCDFVVVPAGAERDVRLDMVTAAPAPPLPRSPSNRWTRRKEARAGFKALRIARRAAVRGLAEVRPGRPEGDLGVLAADAYTAEPVAVEVLRRREGGFDLRLPETPTAPVLLGLDSPRRGLSLRVRTMGEHR